MESLPISLDLSPWQVTYVVVLTVVGSVVSGLSGMGGGVLIAIGITPIVGLKPVLPIVTIAMLMNHLVRVWIFRTEVDWRRARLVLMTAMPLSFVGSLLYVEFTPTLIAIVMGGFLLFSVPLRRYLERRQWQVGDRTLTSAGGLFGLISGTTIGGGAFMVTVLLSSGLAGAALVGTDAVIGLALLIVKFTTFSSMDLFSSTYLFVGVMIGLFTLPGTYLARWIMSNTSIRVHTLFMEGVILFAGGSFVWRGFTE